MAALEYMAHLRESNQRLSEVLQETKDLLKKLQTESV
jgi:hypothetical protein